MNFIEAQASDAQYLADAELKIFNDAWTYDNFIYEINDNPYSKVYLLKNEEEIIGYFGFWITFELCQITTIAVNQEYRGNGYANKMLEFIEQEAIKAECETISLEVRVSNNIARSLYQRNGYHEINIRKSYYSDNFEDAIVMAKGIGTYE